MIKYRFIILYKGDGDPLDVCDLSEKEVGRDIDNHNLQLLIILYYAYKLFISASGDVYSVKVLGCFCLIDQGEVDWKLLTVSEAESKAKNVKMR